MPGLLRFQSRKKEFHDAGSIREAAIVVIDTELTGLNPRKDSIVSVGAVRMNGGRISLGDSFYRLVNPRTALTRESVLIHGIVPSDVASEKDIRSVLDEFTVFCGNAVLLGHCIAIDIEFIDRELKHISRTPLCNPIVDAAELYCWLGKRGLLDKEHAFRPSERDLYRIARWFDIPVAEAHNALADAFIAAQVFQRFLPLLHEQGITTVGDLVRIGDPTGRGDPFFSPAGMSFL